MSRRTTVWTVAAVCLVAIGWVLYSIDLLALLRRLHGQ
jgi:hypothetical protein